MKNLRIIVAIIICFCGNVVGQIDSIKVMPSGLTACNIKTTLKSSVEYDKTLEWITETYKNTKSVIVRNVKNKSITIHGYATNAIKINSPNNFIETYDITYQIHITFSDNIIFFKIEGDTIKTSTYSGKLDVFVSSWYKKNGTYKKKMFNTAKSTYENTANYLLFSYYNKLNNI